MTKYTNLADSPINKFHNFNKEEQAKAELRRVKTNQDDIIKYHLQCEYRPQGGYVAPVKNYWRAIAHKVIIRPHIRPVLP